MCQSKSQGGKRCFGPAMKAFDAALAVKTQAEAAKNASGSSLGDFYGDVAEGMKVYRAWRDSCTKVSQTGIELGSSEHGRAELLRRADAAQAAGDEVTAGLMHGFAEAGKDYEAAREQAFRPSNVLAPKPKQNLRAVLAAVRGTLLVGVPTTMAAGVMYQGTGGKVFGALIVTATVGAMLNEHHERKKNDIEEAVHSANEKALDWRAAQKARLAAAV